MSQPREGVRVGVLLPTREARVAGRDDPAPLLEIAEESETLGYDSVWAGDSPIARPRLDPLTLLAAVAARTERVTVGTAVLLGSLRPPVLTAHAVASLDRIASGRLVVGLGAGFPLPATEAEFEVAGAPFRQRVGRLNETVRLWRQLWTEAEDGPTSVDFDGRYFQFRDLELFPKPARPGGPPLWLAGSSPEALERAGTTYDGWLPYPPSAALYASEWAAVSQAARAEGCDGKVTPGLYVTVALDEDETAAERTLDQYCQSYYGFGLEVMGQVQAFYGGTPAGCAEWLGNYLKAGASHLVLRFATLGDPRPMIRRTAEEVVPLLRAQDANAEVSA
jgi:alkanesulfonate monooxygenase SsuD/methylene tetrahydromethanopterin reductase-like flavin-dependent oxidoreductase (luciferase family)